MLETAKKTTATATVEANAIAYFLTERASLKSLIDVLIEAPNVSPANSDANNAINRLMKYVTTQSTQIIFKEIKLTKAKIIDTKNENKPSTAI